MTVACHLFVVNEATCYVFYGIRAEVLLKLTKEYKPEILHGMKHWKTT